MSLWEKVSRSISEGGAWGWLPTRWNALPVADRRNLVILAAVASAIRLSLILVYSPILTNDSYSYLDLAHRLGSLHLQGWSGTRTPGYPLALLVLGYSPGATWCVQALFGVLATLLVYALVRRLGSLAGPALVAGLLYALDLEVVAVEHMIVTETFTAFLLLVTAHLAISVARERRRRSLAWLCVVLAYLCLVRPDQLAVAVYLAAALWIGLRNTGRGHAQPGARARGTIWVLIAPLAVLVIWAAVNRASIGVSSPSTVLGFNMIDHVGAEVRGTPGPDYPITSAYVQARRKSHATYNLSYVALPAMERASHLDAAHLSGRLLRIALGMIERHPLAYARSSLEQWPQFWLTPNYAYQFGPGLFSGVIRIVWKLQRVVLALIGVVFVLLLVADLALRSRRRDALLSRASLMLAGVAIVGVVPATFLAWGETGRYGFVYFTVVLSVTAATGTLAWQSLAARAPRPSRRPRLSRI